MNLLFLDLEMNQPSNKIIQVGWTIGNPISGRSYEIKGKYVKLDELLNPIISNLCGIQQSNLDQADNLDNVWAELTSDWSNYSCSTNIVTWSKGDLALLHNQIHEDNRMTSPLSPSYIDAKTLYQSWKLKSGAEHLKGGLARAMTKFGLAFNGRKHNAMDDAYNTFKIYSRLLQELK